MLRKYLLVLMFFCSLSMLACLEEDITEDNYDREQNLNKVLMCPVCPGESIDQSQNPLSSKMRDIVKQKVKEGLTDRDQVMAEKAKQKMIKEIQRRHGGPKIVH